MAPSSTTASLGQSLEGRHV